MIGHSTSSIGELTVGWRFEMCGCQTVATLREAVMELADELVEFLREPSQDEFSDCVYAVGRIIGACVGKVYVHVPGDGRHVKKIQRRLDEYGCIRSRKHLVNGRCPSEVEVVK